LKSQTALEEMIEWAAVMAAGCGQHCRQQSAQPVLVFDHDLSRFYIQLTHGSVVSLERAV